jgi:hypothetical protein
MRVTRSQLNNFSIKLCLKSKECSDFHETHTLVGSLFNERSSRYFGARWLFAGFIHSVGSADTLKRDTSNRQSSKQFLDCIAI